MIEKFIKSRIDAVKSAIRQFQATHPHNRLTNSFIYGIDDHQVISPDNRLIHADLGEVPESPAKSK